jgi:hypothetical protein
MIEQNKERKLKFNKDSLYLILIVIGVTIFSLLIFYLEDTKTIKNPIFLNLHDLINFLIFIIYFLIYMRIILIFKEKIQTWRLTLIFIIFLASIAFFLSCVLFQEEIIIRLILKIFICAIICVLEYTRLFSNRRKPYFGFINLVLELAGKRVNEIKNGFTNRPYPVGKYVFSQDELRVFADELKKYEIAESNISEDKTIFIFSRIFHSSSFNRYKHILNKTTHISFDSEGNMTVFIAKKDYEKYKEELTFDQLCQSLGELFMEFFAMYKDGKMDKVLEMLNSVRPKLD